MCFEHIYSHGMTSRIPDSAQGPQEDATLAALSALLKPLAQLALAQGVAVPAVEQLLRRAFVDVARQSLIDDGLPEHRLVSRISTSTGLTRREVVRLSELSPQVLTAAGGSLAAEVFTRWVSDRSLRARDGSLLPLRRHGDAPSFEALARSVTQDVHPRSLLEELCRLELAEVDEAGELVRLCRDAFVPHQDKQQMLGFLADNVGDHLRGVVSNVTGSGGVTHFDQAVFADELSLESVRVAHEFVASQWQRLLAEAVTLLERRIEEDRLAGRPQDQRVRIGLYSYEDRMPSSVSKADELAHAAKRSAARTHTNIKTNTKSRKR